MYKNRLKELREERNLKIYDLSNILEFEKDSYGKYEREYSIIPLKHLNTICNYFDVSLDYVFEFTDVKKYCKIKNLDLDKKEVGKRIKIIRKENKLTQVMLANLLNTVHPVIANYENGKHLIATPFLYDICKKYRISADYLLGRVDEPKYLDKKNVSN